MRIEPAFLFDLDGTLVDSVYQHVLAWKEALDAEGLELSVWRIHRKIGMSGGLFANQTEAIRFAMYECQRHPQSVVMVPNGLELDGATPLLTPAQRFAS